MVTTALAVVLPHTLSLVERWREPVSPRRTLTTALAVVLPTDAYAFLPQSIRRNVVLRVLGKIDLDEITRLVQQLSAFRR